MTSVHGVSPATPIKADAADQVARAMQAGATASRVRLLGRLRQGSCSMGELTEAVGTGAAGGLASMARTARSRPGGRRAIRRHTVDALHDSHVSTLLDEALRHVQHLNAAVPEPSPHPPAAAEEPL